MSLPLASSEAVWQIVVSVGTDHHQFDRLVRWVDDYARRRPDVAILVQRGTSKESSTVLSHALVPHSELRSLFSKATAVVCHGGPSTVMDARAAGRLPIVVPRDPEFGEHVDGHQVRFAHHLEAKKMATVAWSEAELFTALDAVLANPAMASVPIEDVTVPAGVVSFGRAVDELLGITTPISNPARKPPSFKLRRNLGGPRAQPRTGSE